MVNVIDTLAIYFNMASLDQDEESYWQESGSVSFIFDENEDEFVSIDKIENEKQEQLHAKSSKARVSIPVSFNNPLRSINIHRDPVKPVPSQSRTLASSSTQSVEDAILQMVMGSQVSLEQFRGLNDKLDLLDEALRWHDGNAILCVLYFLKGTLKSRIFIQELLKRPVALNHYIKFLSVHQDITLLSDLLTMLGNNEEAAVFLYKNLISSKSGAESKLQNLKKLHSNHFQSNPELVFINKLVLEQIRLLEHQLPIEESDTKIEKDNKNLIFLEFPRPALPCKSVMSTLYYCCLYHYHLPENNLASPTLVKKVYNMSDKQFVWTALQALIKNKVWKDIEMLFQTKSWIKGTKLTCCIGFDKVVKLLHKADAPIDEVAKYLSLLDLTQRLQVAKKYKYNRIVVDTIVALRDRQELESFAKVLIPNSPDHLYAMESLRSSSIKWKK